MYDFVSSSASYGAVLFNEKPQLYVSTSFFKPKKSIRTASELGLIHFFSTCPPAPYAAPNRTAWGWAGSTSTRGRRRNKPGLP